MIRSSSSTWVRSPSSGESGTRRSDSLERSLAGSAPTDSIVRKLFALIARAHQMLGDSQAGAAACAEGLEARPRGCRAVVPQGGRASASGRSHRRPSGRWRRILDLRRPEQFCSFDQGIYGHLTRRNLAALAAERGDHAEARRLWEAVLAECPGDREALAKLGRGEPVPASVG